MKITNQSKLLTLQVIVFLFFLSTQNSFAQNKKINLKDWQGSYVGIGYSNSKLVDDHIEMDEDEPSGYTDNIPITKKTPSIFIGYNWVLEKNILSGLEFSIEKRNFFKDSYQKYEGVIDTDYPTILKSKGYGYSLKGRVGEIINDQTLIYVAGGIVQIPMERKYCTDSCYSGSEIDTFKRNERGLMLEFGLEHKLQGDISFKFNYEHRKYSTPDFVTINAYGPNYKEIHDTKEHSFRVSLIKSF